MKRWWPPEGPESVLNSSFPLGTRNKLHAPKREATGVSENLLTTLLTALMSLELIVEREGRFVNAPTTAKFLWWARPATSGTICAS